MKALSGIYKTLRSVLLSAILIAGGLYVALYILVSLPGVQSRLKGIAEREASAFLQSDVSVEKLSISPFSEVQLYDVGVLDQHGDSCLRIRKVGAGINLWRLLTKRRVVLTYAEIIGLDARVRQSEQGAPLNIDFIIKAFAPKDKNKPPTKFDLAIQNIVIRDSRLRFDREWCPAPAEGRFSADHIDVKRLRADIAIPLLKNDDFLIDLRRLSLEERSGLDVRTLTAKAHITATKLSVEGIRLELPGTILLPNDFILEYPALNQIGKAIRTSTQHIRLDRNCVTPTDLAPFLPMLASFTTPMTLSLIANGSAERISLEEFVLTDDTEGLLINLKASGRDFGKPEERRIEVDKIKLSLSADWIRQIIAAIPQIPAKATELIAEAGAVKIEGDGSLSGANADGNLAVSTEAGNIQVDGLASWQGKHLHSAKANVSGEGLALDRLWAGRGLGTASFDLLLDASFSGSHPIGTASLDVHEFQYKDCELAGLNVSVLAQPQQVSARIESPSPDLLLTAEAALEFDSGRKPTGLIGNLDIERLNLHTLGVNLPKEIVNLSGHLSVNATGTDMDNLNGQLSVTDLVLSEAQHLKPLKMRELTAECHTDSLGNRSMQLRSDYADADVSGRFRLQQLPEMLRNMAASALPSLLGAPTPIAYDPTLTADFSATIKKENTLTEYFNAPVRLLVDIPVKGSINGLTRTATLNIDIPYLQQGRDKLVRDTKLEAALNSMDGSASLTLTSLMPAKQGEVRLNLNTKAVRDIIDCDIAWDFNRERAFRGNVALKALLSRPAGTSAPSAVVNIRPSTFFVNDTAWNVAPGYISYADKRVDIRGLHVGNQSQYVNISGRASALPGDTVRVALQAIDLGFVFDALAINYVTFGGIATGDVRATNVFTQAPEALTDNLRVKSLAYNGAELGDALIRSEWNNSEKCVEIKADVEEDGRRVARIDGGVWVTSDSLNFTFDTDRVRIGFLRPFMQAFCSHVGGRASGQAHLYGNFHDIDLTGRLKADSISMQIDFTNVMYTAMGDSVRIDPGYIRIPAVTVRDKYGNTAKVSGELTHNYFHDPTFRFSVTDANKILCFDTDERHNPLWFGTIFGSGSGNISGYPGLLSIDMNMSTAPHSSFTFIIDETETAVDYEFLTFTDRSKQLREIAEVHEEDFVEMFRKRQENTEMPSVFKMDLRATVTPDAQLTMVMDKQAGDRIRARGAGALQIGYTSDSDEMSMFGKYTLTEGSYNFTLQDIIIKDFKIREGSSIAFNGNPYDAVLDIDAIYRVNTNLSDLDKSFSSDRELNRTNVPVDAVLSVTGHLEEPEITFDIELPTLTQDVVRKVKSIISTDDMMNRQILYLLALNRFYTPEYMNAGSGGGELTAVASSTISSQLTNILGQLSDKWTFAPSFRSEKGDFSDVEVDVALSSRLLNNRLLLNGNFGYRDRNTSNTTFVGDFDVEYLLVPSGNLRLKAYNHFNDQNYYLKSSLTTQGLGVVYRRDFDNLFSFLRRKKKTDKEKTDSVSQPTPSEPKSTPKTSALGLDTLKKDKGDDLLKFK